MSGGALSGPMVDAVLTPRCLELAQAAVASRRGAWIERACKTINAHNESIERNGGRCQLCGHRDHGIIWEPPRPPRGWMADFLARRFPSA